MDELSAQTTTKKIRRKSSLKIESSYCDSGSLASGRNIRKKKMARFNEENLLETYHPVDKDYGFDSIEEVKTPFVRDGPPIDPEELNERLLAISPGIDESGESEQSPQPSSNENRGGASGASNSLSTTSFSEMTFAEKRRKHVQSEFVVAKQTLTMDNTSEAEEYEDMNT